MKIVSQHCSCYFKDLKEGDVFIFYLTVAMKIPLVDKYTYKVNAITLSDGGHLFFDSEELVLRKPDAVILVDGEK